MLYSKWFCHDKEVQQIDESIEQVWVDVEVLQLFSTIVQQCPVEHSDEEADGVIGGADEPAEAQARGHGPPDIEPVLPVLGILIDSHPQVHAVVKG